MILIATRSFHPLAGKQLGKVYALYSLRVAGIVSIPLRGSSQGKKTPSRAFGQAFKECFHPLAGKQLGKVVGSTGGGKTSVSIPLRGSSQGKDPVAGIPQGVYPVSIPLRGSSQGKNHSSGNDVLWYFKRFHPLAGKQLGKEKKIKKLCEDYTFPSPCGEVVRESPSPQEYAPDGTCQFPSPCGEVVRERPLQLPLKDGGVIKVSIPLRGSSQGKTPELSH